MSIRKKFSAPFWAVFVADAFDDTMFVGLFAASYRGLLEADRPKPHVVGEIDSENYHADGLKRYDQRAECISSRARERKSSTSDLQMAKMVFGAAGNGNFKVVKWA